MWVRQVGDDDRREQKRSGDRSSAKRLALPSPLSSHFSPGNLLNWVSVKEAFPPSGGVLAV